MFCPFREFWIGIHNALLLQRIAEGTRNNDGAGDAASSLHFNNIVHSYIFEIYMLPQELFDSYPRANFDDLKLLSDSWFSRLRVHIIWTRSQTEQAMYFFFI